MKLTSKTRTFKVTFTNLPGTKDAPVLVALTDAIESTSIPGATRTKINGTKLSSWFVTVGEKNATTLWRSFNRWMWKHGEELGSAKIEILEGKAVVETATLSGLVLTDLSDMNLQKGEENDGFSVGFEPTSIVWS